MVDMPEIALKLSKNGLGGSITCESNGRLETFLYLHTLPTDLSLVALSTGLFVPREAKFIRKLCELSDNARGYKSRWSCKLKEPGRYDARCSCAGKMKKPSGEGIRSRASKKVGCTAQVRTRSNLGLSVEDLSAIAESMTRDSERTFTVDDICCISIVSRDHTGHVLPKVDCEKVVLHRIEDLLTHKDISDSLMKFLRLKTIQRGYLNQAMFHLRDEFPNIIISKDVLANAVRRLQINNSDCSLLVETMMQELEVEQIEFFDTKIHQVTKILLSITWAPKGSRNVVRRCGDIAFWDSTHHVTSYHYKLSAMTGIDSEGKSRALLLSLNLHEDMESCLNILNCWERAFSSRIPAVIFSDGDRAFSGAIRALPYSDGITHLLCTHHLFDTNTRRNVSSAIGASSGDLHWKQFRKGLAMCQKAMTEKELDRLWSELLTTWLGNESQEKARKYMMDFVWSKRRQWAHCFFRTSFTLGHTTTQRSESFNSVVRCSSSSISLVDFYRSVKSVVQDQGDKENRALDSRYRLIPVQSLNKCIKRTAESIQLSNFAASFLASELSQAHFIKLLNFSVREDGHIQCSAVPAYNSASKEVVQTRVELNLSDTAISRDDLFHKGAAACECHFMFRARMPCQHIIAVAMHMDKCSEYDYIIRRTISTSRSVLETVIAAYCHPRWCRKAVKDKFDSQANESSDDGFEKDETIESQADHDANMLTINSESERTGSSDHLSLMHSQKGRITYKEQVRLFGQKETYSKLLKSLTSLALVCLKDSVRNKLGHILIRFSQDLRNEILQHEFERKKSNANPDVASIFKSKLRDYEAHSVQKKELNADQIMAEMKCLADVCANSAFKIPLTDGLLRASDKALTMLNSKEMKISVVFESIEQAFNCINWNNCLSEEHSTKTELQAASNPPRRKKIIPLRPIAFKSKKFQKTSKKRSLRAPTSSHISASNKLEIPVKPTATMFACPFCTTCKICKNFSNVLQHVRSKHEGKRQPSPEDCFQAAKRRIENIEAMTKGEEGQITKSNSQNEQRSVEVGDVPNRYSNLGVCTRNSTTSNVISSETVTVRLSGSVRRSSRIKKHLSNHSFMATKVWKTNFERLSSNITTPCSIEEASFGWIFEILDQSQFTWRSGRISYIFSAGTRVNVHFGSSSEGIVLSDCYWRIRRPAVSYPSLALNTLTPLCSAVDEYKNRSRNNLLTSKILNKLAPEELERFKPCRWLSDDIIMNFLFTLLRISTNPGDVRFFAVDSQAIRRVKDEGIQNHSKGIAFHDIDVVIWPFEISKHWYLCVGYICQRKIILLDPYDPGKDYSGAMEYPKVAQLVLEGLTLLTKDYDEKNLFSKSWTFQSAKDVPDLLPLPVQPSSNSFDCGVIVCCYIWSILTGESWKTILSRISSFSAFMSSCRVNIGGIICDTILHENNCQ